MPSLPFREQSLSAPIDVAGPAKAWQTVVERLLETPDRTLPLIIVRMKEPLASCPRITAAHRAFTQMSKLPSAEGVSATIFPRGFYRFNCKSDRKTLYKGYSQFRARTARLFGKKPSFSYFDRLISWQPEGAPTPVNQLETFISRMNNYKAKREAWYFYPTIDPSRDLGKIMGGPCLSAIDLKYEIEHNILNLSAFYRDHEFAEKAYGNYLGLSYLLEFLCEQTRTAIGALTCVSFRARIEGHTRALQKLVESLR